MEIEFAVFLPHMKSLIYWLHTVAELIVSAINSLKTVGRGHAVHERQGILLTMVVISIHFVWQKRMS